MKTKVQLPSDPLIDYWLFCQAIAQAICPASEQDLKGIDCIVGKLEMVHVPMAKGERWPAIAGLQSVLLSDDGRPLNQLRLDQRDAAASSTPSLALGGELQHNVFDFTFPYKLTDDDRQLMEKLLEDLPALHYPMSEDDVASFMNAYVNLPGRPAWIPTLITAREIEQRKAKQHAVMLQHQKKLQDELTLGRLVAVNANHVPVTRLAVGDFLPRDQAIAYLERCGIAHYEKEVGGLCNAETQMPTIHREPLGGKKGALGERKLSDKETRDIVALYDELKRKGVKAFCKQVAEKFEITDRYVRKLVENAKAKQDDGRIDLLVVKKR